MKSPFIGEFDKRATLRAWQDLPDATTGIDPTLGAGMGIWCRITPTGSAIFYGTEQVESGVTHRLATWRTAQVNAEAIGMNHRVEHAGMEYRIRRVTDLSGERTFVLIDLEQLGRIRP